MTDLLVMQKSCIMIGLGRESIGTDRSSVPSGATAWNVQYGFASTYKVQQCTAHHTAKSKAVSATNNELQEKTDAAVLVLELVLMIH
jgi:hypothetical protein